MFYGKCITSVPSHQSCAPPHYWGFEPTEPLGLYCTLRLCLLGKQTKHHTSLLTGGREIFCNRTKHTITQTWIQKLFRGDICSVKRYDIAVQCKNPHKLQSKMLPHKWHLQRRSLYVCHYNVAICATFTETFSTSTKSSVTTCWNSKFSLFFSLLENKHRRQT